MAPTEGVSSPKAVALSQTKKADADGKRDYHTDSLPRMTPELLQSICTERQMWSQPHLNTQLFLNYKGFLRIEGMEDYFNVRSLHLDNNNISKIEGLDRMSDLRSLHLGGNRIEEILNLESNTELRILNLEANAIRHVASVRHLVKLETLNLSANRVEQLEDLANLKELPALINLDVSNNSVDAEEGVVEFWSEFKNLKVLRYHGNPGVRHIAHYRKGIINAIPSLSYMDERPVFVVERKACQAWVEGGLTAMHEAKKEFQRQRIALCGVDPERRDLVTRNRQLAIERIERQEKEREEKDRAREEAEKKAANMEPGTSEKASTGDLEGLKQYEAGWKTKVNLYGVDGVRTRVAQETTGGRGTYSSQAGETSASQGFNFAPPHRDEALRAEPEMRAEPEPAASLPVCGLFSATHHRDEALRAEPEMRAEPEPAVSLPGRREQRPHVDVANFRHSSSGKEVDYADRQFSVLGNDAEVSLGHAESSGGASRKGATRQAAGAADESTMPLIWQQRQAENLAAEAACLEYSAELAGSSSRGTAGASDPAAFRSQGLESLD